MQFMGSSITCSCSGVSVWKSKLVWQGTARSVAGSNRSTVGREKWRESAWGGEEGGVSEEGGAEVVVVVVLLLLLLLIYRVPQR